MDPERAIIPVRSTYPIRAEPSGSISLEERHSARGTGIRFMGGDFDWPNAFPDKYHEPSSGGSSPGMGH